MGRPNSFNPRPPARSDHRSAPGRRPAWCFNPRPPARSDILEDHLDHLLLGGFNPRPPARSDEKKFRDKVHYLKFQSTPPCEERHRPQPCPNRLTEVSIHAPLRGATGDIAPGRDGAKVSIHAPLRGATAFHGPALRFGVGFNPRPPARSDTINSGTAAKIYVSIHAPLRGATALPKNSSRVE